MGLTSRQIVEARRLLGWRAWQLAVQAGLSPAMVVLAEVGEDRPPVPVACVGQIWAALEAAGIYIIGDDGEAQSIRLRQPTSV